MKKANVLKNIFYNIKIKFISLLIKKIFSIFFYFFNNNNKVINNKKLIFKLLSNFIFKNLIVNIKKLKKYYSYI